MKYIHHYNHVPKTVKWRYFDPSNGSLPLQPLQASSRYLNRER